MNKDFINILRELRGTSIPGQPYTDGIWYELTIADKNGNPGIYGDILAKYGIVTESAGTFDQAVEILENLNVVVTTLAPGAQATSELIEGVWHIGIPAGNDGIDGEDGTDGENGYTPVKGVDYRDGIDGRTPVLALSYNEITGELNYTVTYVDVVDTPITDEEW